MNRIFPILLLFCAVPILCGADLKRLSAQEKQFLPYSGKEVFSLGKDDWKISAGEIKAAISPSFDDSKWFAGKADCALSVQGFSKRKLHTIRKTFNLPAGLEKKNLLLDLGYISFYDKVYLNGKFLGSFGSYPKGLHGSSWVRRKYFVPADGKWLKAGKNTLTLFVFPGSSSGMYCGIPAFKEVDSFVFPGFKLKTKGSEALAFNLSDAEHLNNYRPGVPLNLEMNLSSIHGPEQPGVLTAEILNREGKVLQKARTKGTLRKGFKTHFAPLKFTAPDKYGNYRFKMSFSTPAKTLWTKSCALTVSRPVKFTLPVDKKLKNAPFKYNVSKDSTGHFGPRHHKNGKLVYDFSKADTRGTLAFSIRPVPEAPLLLMPNVCASPKNQPATSEFLTAKGHQYDGFVDGWIFGNVLPSGSGKLVKTEVKSADWGEITWHYTFEKGQMQLTASTVHPALRIRTQSPALRLFANADFYGTGLPAQAAAMVNKKLFTAKLDSKFPVSKLSENWMLVWFSGNPAYNQFDIPWLIVFKHKVKAVSTAGNLEFDFGKKGAGEVLMMPLYGVTLQRPSVTAKWQKSLPEEVIRRCRTWSRILAAAPQAPVRTFQVDFARDTTTINDRYTHRLLNDDWKTVPLKVAPVYPLLPLILSSGAIKGAIHAPALDLDYATSHGPLFAIPGNGVTIQFENLLHYVSEVRILKQAPRSKLPKEMIARLNKLMMRFLHGPLKEHPGKWLFWRGKFVPGNSEGEGSCGFSDVLDAFRYCASNITVKQKIEFKKEVENYFLYEGVLPLSAQKHLLPKLRKKAVAAKLSSPTGKTLYTFHPNEDDFGIDSCCWEALRLYGLWDYARTCKGYPFIRENWKKIKNYYNMIPNSHDWALGISFDTFSGIRVGNGLQETGIMHAGMTAMARMAHEIKDFEMRDRASYYSVMQLCGLLGAMSANAYLRDFRPTVAGNNREAETVYCEYYRKIHYSEFNENGGFTQYVMNAKGLLNSRGSYVMTPLPEVMRPYREIFTKQTEDFFNPAYEHIPFNRSLLPISPKTRQYMLKKYPLSAIELYQRRKNFAFDVLEHITDICAALDSLGEVRYKKLWNK